MIATGTFAKLKDGNAFHRVFPDGLVPICSIVPIRPRDENAPLCYVVKADALSDEQAIRLADLLYEMWKPECQSLDAALTYIRQGLPLNVDHFRSVTSDDMKLIQALIDDMESSGSPMWLQKDDAEEWEIEFAQGDDE